MNAPLEKPLESAMADHLPPSPDPLTLPELPRLTRRMRWLKWTVPLAVFVLVFVSEWSEHFGPSNREMMDQAQHFWVELSTYGLLIPAAVWLLIEWLQRASTAHDRRGQHLRVLVEEVVAAQQAVNEMNAELERRVDERTRELEAVRDALTKKNEELTALDELKSEFVSLISHELRSPLTNINGGIELLLRRERDLSERARKTLRTLSSQSQRMTRLVETILNISAIEAGKLALRLEPLDVQAVIVAQVEACEAGSARHRIRLSVDRGLPPVLADEGCLSNVLSTLLDNARKYAPKGEIEVGARRDNGSVRITVADHGAGIAPGEHERVFEMFYRVDSADDRELYGYGVGLYASRRLVEAMNGRIWVESAPGEGARFHFTLPLAGIGAPGG